MNGLALTILVSQLPKLCGFSVDADGLLPGHGVRPWVSDGDVVAVAAVLGAACLALILLIQRWVPTVPGVLVAVICHRQCGLDHQPRRRRGRGHARASCR
jgi:MFS superfamily sulfate permease-like transporter